AKALKWSTTSAAAPTTLVTTNFPAFSQLSPDENWILGYTTQATVSGITENDFILASSTTAGAADVLTTDTSSAAFGDVFTTDSSHVVFYTAITSGAGPLNVAATSGG